MSPIVDHQAIPNFSKEWTFVNLTETKINHTVIHDGRTFYFDVYKNKSECKVKPLPKLSSVTYLSNGKTLNSTFWLSDPPINGTFSQLPFLNATQIHQQFLEVTIRPSNRTLNDLIRQENSSLTKQNFTDLKKVNATQIKLDKNPAYKYQFTAKLKPVFGDFGVNAMDILTIMPVRRFIAL